MNNVQCLLHLLKPEKIFQFMLFPVVAGVQCSEFLSTDVRNALKRLVCHLFIS